MRTLDLRKQLKPFHAPRPGRVELVEVPRLSFLMIDGEVSPGAKPGDWPEFQAAIGALYGAAYTLKFTFRKRPLDPVDFPVMALEGLWPPSIVGFEGSATEPWPYTLMILEPEIVTAADLAAAVKAVLAKRGDNPALARLRLEAFQEGLAVQALHVGPYATEGVTIARMQAFAAEQGCRPHGRHHEIYLGDPRRSAPERLRTVLRQPVEASAGR